MVFSPCIESYFYYRFVLKLANFCQTKQSLCKVLGETRKILNVLLKFVRNFNADINMEMVSLSIA